MIKLLFKCCSFPNINNVNKKSIVSDTYTCYVTRKIKLIAIKKTRILILVFIQLFIFISYYII